MKKNFKKVIVAALCISLIGVTQGCKKKADDGMTVVKVWTGNGHDKAFVNDIVEEWNNSVGKEKGIRIEYTVQSGGMDEKIDLAMQNGTAPDIFQGGDMEKLVANDQIVAFEDIPGTEEIMDRFADYILPTRSQINGKTYSVPRKCTTYGMIYNIDMFKAAGLVDENGEATPPKTLAEMREYAKILTNPEKKEYGIIYPGKFAAWYGIDVAKMAVPSIGFISSYNPATGKFDTSAEVEVAKTHIGIKKDGSYYPDVEGLDNDPARALFAEGGIGMKTAGSFDYGVLTSQFPAKINWGVAPFPVKDLDHVYMQHMDLSGGYFVNKASLNEKGADKIAEVLKLFYSNDYIRRAYEQGLDMPLNSSFIEGAKIDSSLPQAKNWEDFCKLADISKPSEAAIKTDTTGKDSLSKQWLEKIWPNMLSDKEIEEIGAEWQKNLNDGIEEYKKVYPDYDATPYIDKDWDARR